jgi:hypothetical protein
MEKGKSEEFCQGWKSLDEWQHRFRFGKLVCQSGLGGRGQQHREKG